MKKWYILVGSFIFFSGGYVLLPKHLTAKNSGQSLSANYSAVNGGLTCNTSGCHTGTLNSGGGSVTVTTDIPATGYVPGQTYSVQVQVTAGGSNGSKYGFSASAVKSGTSTFTNGFAASDATTLAKSGGQFIVHNSSVAGSGPNSSHTFSFQWTAPASGTGDVTFFAAGNSANGNNSDSGDQIYTGSLTVSEAPGAGLTESIANAFNLFPNPAEEMLSISVPDHLIGSTVRVIDVQGKTVLNQQLNDSSATLNVSAFTAGYYVVELLQNGQVYTSRFVKK
jgi:hypothetical protein